MTRKSLMAAFAAAVLGATLALAPAGASAQKLPVPQPDSNSQYFKDGSIGGVASVKGCAGDGYFESASIVVELSQSDAFAVIGKLADEGKTAKTTIDVGKDMDAIWKSVLAGLTSRDFAGGQVSDKALAAAGEQFDDYAARILKQTEIHFRVNEIQAGKPIPGCTP